MASGLTGNGSWNSLIRLGDRLQAGGHRGQAAHHHREANRVAEPRLAIRPLRYIGRAAGFRVAAANAGIRQPGEQRGDHRAEKRQPNGIAQHPRRLADQHIDTGAEHRTEAVKQDLPRADGLLQRGGVGIHARNLTTFIPAQTRNQNK
jgi:hypothetical protein